MGKVGTDEKTDKEHKARQGKARKNKTGQPQDTTITRPDETRYDYHKTGQPQDTTITRPGNRKIRQYTRQVKTISDQNKYRQN